jgi:hypothetical protein
MNLFTVAPNKSIRDFYKFVVFPEMKVAVGKQDQGFVFPASIALRMSNFCD